MVNAMSDTRSETGWIASNGARIRYECAGAGMPFVMLHAGVADCRQWDREFAGFAARHKVVRYDLRGHGRSEPVDGDFTHLADLSALVAQLALDTPFVLMGCSMGGGVAMDYALAHPEHVAALIMVGAGPSGLALDVPAPDKFAEAEAAFEAGDLDLAAELETQIWFDGVGRRADQVDAAARRLARDMDRGVLEHAAKKLGKRRRDRDVNACERLAELRCPVLVVIGEHDIAYMQAAADFMTARLPNARRVTIRDAAHLPNLDHPDEFARVVADFLATALA